MSRFLSILLGSLMLTALMAGCFGGDEDDGDAEQPDPTDTPTPTNNTTAPPPNQVPQPSFILSVSSNGTAYEKPYLVQVEDPLDISFDGSASTDEDGEVVDHAWTITDPQGKEYSGKGATFDVNVDKAKGSSHFGVWNVQLRVIDDQQGIGQITDRFVIHYSNVIDQEGFTGPGTAERNDVRDEPVGSRLAEGLPLTGQYRIEGITVASNATEMQITLTFDDGGPMALYLFGPDQDPADPEEEPVATADSSGSPVELTVTAEDLSAVGRYNLRCELDGNEVGDYTVSTVVLYGAQTALPANNTTA